MLVFSSTLVSELAYTALMLAAMLLIERAADQDGVKAAIAAGIVAGLAYLTRSAGIVFLVAGPLYLWMRHKRREADSLGLRDAAVRRGLDHLDATASGFPPPIPR